MVVHIQHSGGSEEYKKEVDAAFMKIGEAFGFPEVRSGRIKLSATSDETFDSDETTGNFEVAVNGLLLHSKAAGDGFMATNEDTLAKVLGKIKESM